MDRRERASTQLSKHSTRTSQRENPENLSAALAEAYATHSASYDLRTGMIDDFLLEGKREEKPSTHRKPSSRKGSRAPGRPRGAQPRGTAARRRQCWIRVGGIESSLQHQQVARTFRRSTHSTDSSTTVTMQTATAIATAKNTSPSTPTTRRKDRGSANGCLRLLQGRARVNPPVPRQECSMAGKNNGERYHPGTSNPKALL